ncbi:MAG: GNAT family N-acetyltransferase [Stappiaceae bacterium]
MGSITVRAMEPDDWDAIAAIMGQDKVISGTLRLPFQSRTSLHKLLERRQNRGINIVACRDDTVLGVATMWRLEGRMNHTGQLILTVDENHHRQGVGNTLMAGLVQTADKWWALRRLELTVNVDNVAAIALYEKFGFTIEGTARDSVFRDGHYVDCHWMARINHPTP